MQWFNVRIAMNHNGSSLEHVDRAIKDGFPIAGDGSLIGWLERIHGIDRCVNAPTGKCEHDISPIERNKFHVDSSGGIHAELVGHDLKRRILIGRDAYADMSSLRVSARRYCNDQEDEYERAGSQKSGPNSAHSNAPCARRSHAHHRDTSD